MYLAERKGFEPSIRYSRIHAFQACDLNHSSTSLMAEIILIGIICYLVPGRRLELPHP
ncbi:hypothetical protein ESCNG_30078 [Neisseria gonorrhoeae]|nr:hypothetical protein ESCNG_10079 [Neisseria gonorrhoeae]SCW08510.1 hypothetical protein ESCNG_10294 [Neisseria gonorrhoeae]SCW14152.1 hypothetical protein ESCNG_30078 [Neisseria gonorrhoeae]SCW20307.1 hypothetical protein ESCNG_70083 [Neisseria gonorrhoeae]